MTLRISFELSDSDVEYFCQVMLRVRANLKNTSPEQTIAAAQDLLATIDQSDSSDFIRHKMSQLETLINMVTDEGWGLAEEDRERVLAALSYFSEGEDIIPDDTPAIGFLDDAIMAEIICKELEHEIQAYHEFTTYRDQETAHRGDDARDLSRSEWLEELRQQLHSRMRRRRRGRTASNKTKSPFSLF